MRNASLTAKKPLCWHEVVIQETLGKGILNKTANQTLERTQCAWVEDQTEILKSALHQTLLNDVIKMLCCANLNGDSPTNNTAFLPNLTLGRSTTGLSAGQLHNEHNRTFHVTSICAICYVNSVLAWPLGQEVGRILPPFPWQCQSPGRTCTQREKSRKVQWFLGSESITLAALLQQQSCSSSCRWQLELCGNLVKSLSFWLMQGRYKIWIRIFYLESQFQKVLIVKAPSLGSLTVRRSRAILLSENCYQYGMAIFSHTTTSPLGFQPYYSIPHYD